MSHVLSGPSTHRQAHSQQCPFRNPTKAHCTPGPPRVSRQKGRRQAVKEAVQSRDLKSDAELFAEEVGAQDVPSPEAALPDPDRVQQLRQECAAAAKQACLACSCQNSDSLCAPRTVAIVFVLVVRPFACRLRSSNRSWMLCTSQPSVEFRRTMLKVVSLSNWHRLRPSASLAGNRPRCGHLAPGIICHTFAVCL